MKTPIRRYHLALLFSLLTLFGVSISAQRIWETLPASFKEKMHSTRRATESSVSPGKQATNTSAEPAQDTLAIPQNVLPGGGGTSAGGTLSLDGTIGQGLAGGAMTGGSLSASSGFWGGAAANQCPTITVTNPQNPSGVIGTALSRTFTQTGGVGAIAFSLNSGTLPTGVTLATNGTLSGTPMQFGNFPITVKATDSNNCTGIGATYTLVISCQSLSVFNPSVTTATVGQPFTANFTHTGGLGTVTFMTNNNALPPGLVLAPNGTLSGTPTQAGSFTFTVSIGDGNNCGVSGLPYTLVVSPGTTTARVIRAAGASGNPGGVVVVPIELVSQGDENAISSSLTFDPSVLSNPQVALGSDANGASQNVNVSQVTSGRLGLIVALPSGQAFSMGTRRIFAVTFTIAANTSANTTPIGFGNQPVAQEVASVAAAALPVSFVAGTVTISRGIEADVTPAPDGNGSVTVTDYVKVGRFAAGLDTPTVGGEFQRADCAPRSTLGNGAITVSDYVQAGRYAAGLDELVPAGGPTAPINLLPELEKNLAMADKPVAQNAGQPVTINLRQDALLTAGVLAIELSSQGTENAMAFSLSFDPNVWRLVAAVNGRDARGATLLVNEAETAEGRIGFLLALPTGAKLSAGQRQLALVRFARIAGSAKGDQPNGAISFSDLPVARELVDVEGNTLSADYSISNGNTGSEIARTAAVVSAAGIEGEAFASEAIAAIFGKGLASFSQLADSQPLPLELAGTRVMVRDSEGIERSAPLLFVSPGQINFQIPAGTAQGFASITIIGGDGTTSFGTARIEDPASKHVSAKADKWTTATAVVLRESDGAQQYESLSRYDAEEGRIVPLPLKAATEGEQVFLILFDTETRHAKTSNALRASIIGSEGEDAAEVISAKADGDSASSDQVKLHLPQTLKNSGVMEARLTVNGKTVNKVRIFVR